MKTRLRIGIVTAVIAVALFQRWRLDPGPYRWKKDPQASAYWNSQLGTTGQWEGREYVRRSGRWQYRCGFQDLNAGSNLAVIRSGKYLLFDQIHREIAISLLRDGILKNCGDLAPNMIGMISKVQIYSQSGQMGGFTVLTMDAGQKAELLVFVATNVVDSPFAPR